MPWFSGCCWLLVSLIVLMLSFICMVFVVLLGVGLVWLWFKGLLLLLDWFGLLVVCFVWDAAVYLWCLVFWVFRVVLCVWGLYLC